MRKKSNCLRYDGRPKCRFTEVECTDEYAQTCTDYKSDEGTYLCPHCNRKGLKLLNYGSDENPEMVWECLRCGAELWYCETVEEMQERCREIRERVIEPRPISENRDIVNGATESNPNRFSCRF